VIQRVQVVRAAVVSVGLGLFGTAWAAPGDVLADRDDDEKKAKEEWKEAEGKQDEKKGQKPGEGAQGQPGAGGLEENPLPKILELMKQVEGRLFEADTGDFTQDEQKQIVEAMRFEEKTHEALEELIKKIEEEMQKQQQQQSSSSSSEQQKQQQKQQQQQNQNQNETEEQRRQREEEQQRRMEQQRRAEEQRRMQQNQQQQNQQNQQQPQDGREQRSEQEQREGRPPEDDQNPLNEADRRAGPWGRLPRKLFQDAANARNHEPPSKFRDLIEQYRQRLAETNPR
jgi:flagellar biosynthesis GTPase FlhF